MKSKDVLDCGKRVMCYEDRNKGFAGYDKRLTYIEYVLMARRVEQWKQWELATFLVPEFITLGMDVAYSFVVL